MTDDPISSASQSAVSLSRFWLICISITSLIFLAIAPTLRWLEFSNSAEALNVATAQEIRRTGQWVIPTLQGLTRWAKPPLAAWITASLISNPTMEALSNPDQGVRDRGFAALEWQTRWPALLAACLTLLLTAELARLLAGPACGPLAIAVAGTCILFLRFGRYSTTDIHLALWVTAGNVLLLHALLRRRFWIGFFGAGVALGLAMMSKGPVSLVQSVLPIGIWWAWSRWKSRDLSPSPGTPGRRVAEAIEGRGEGLPSSVEPDPHPIPLPEYRARGQESAFRWPVLAGIGAFIVFGLWWFILVFARDPSVTGLWFKEVTREGATEAPPSKWYSYFTLFPYLMPWTIFAVGGAVVTIRQRATGGILALLLLLIPILVMSLAKDRNERYLLPMLPAAAVLAAIGIQALPENAVIRGLHGIGLALIGVGFPIATLFFDPPWYTTLEAVATAICSILLVERGFLPERRQKHLPLVTTLIVMLALQAVFIFGYRNTREGRAELRPMADQIAAQYPDAEIFNAHPKGKRPPPELGVYLNRIIQWTDDPSTIQPGTKPKVLLMLQDHDQPAPTPPSGWQVAFNYPRDKDHWWAFVLRAGGK